MTLRAQLGDQAQVLSTANIVHGQDAKSIKAIVRELRVSRRTVRKVIRSEETNFSQ